MHSSVLAVVLLSLLPSILYAQEVCCLNECYYIGYPWETTDRILPPPTCLQNPVKYLCSNRSNPVYPVVYSTTNVSKIGEFYDATKPTVILFHGWMGSENSNEIRNITAMYLAQVDANAIYVDYAEIALNPVYAQASSDIRVAATYVIKMVHLLLSLGTDPSEIHLIGFSLGVQLAAYVAKAIPGIGRLTVCVPVHQNIKIVRNCLTGLDPAGPYFSNQSCEVRFCRGDAIFTEAIHTNGDPTLGFGTYQADADVNFWVNGGWEQPNCGITVNPLFELELSEIQNYDDLMILVVCSHFRSPLIYAEALASACTFWGVTANKFNIRISRLTLGYLTKYIVHPQNCTLDTCDPIGLETINATGRGSFLVATNYEPPFCVGQS